MGKDYIEKKGIWTSKSKIKDLEYCPYSFWLDRIKGEKKELPEVAIEGTNLHMVFHSFYEVLKPHHVFKDEFTDPRTPINRHPFRKFIYDACMEFVKPDQREYGKYKNVLSNFATIECARFTRLNSILHNKKEIFDCFTPLVLERRLEYKPLHLYGTIDRVNVEVMPDGSKKIAIYDYKTGNVPSSVQKYNENTMDMFQWTLPTHYMKEIHFYGLLYLLSSGWQLGDEVIDFLENPEWWYTKKGKSGLPFTEVFKEKGKYLTGLKKKYKLFKDTEQSGRKVFDGNDLILGFYFLNGDKGYRPIKKFNYASHKGVLLSTNKYRSVMYNKHYVTTPKPVYNFIGCEKKRCVRYKECTALVERKD